MQAWKRSKSGAFSASARIAAFLTGISAMNVEIIHTPGKEMISSDYNSRHPSSCSDTRCQICKFAAQMEIVGDQVFKVTVADIENGIVNMPYLQRPAWLKVQKNDKIHQKLASLISLSQSPEKKKTGGDFTTLKRLHSLYTKGQLKQDADGLFTVSNIDQEKGHYKAVSVPANIFPGLVQALHLKLHHPSKGQLQKLVSRYFYTPGSSRIIEDITANCLTCASLKQLPDALVSESTVKTPIFGASFSADIVSAHGQKILIVREKLSQFTCASILKDETAECIRTNIIAMIADFIPSSGAVVQVDCATSFQTLHNESNTKGTDLNSLNIKIDLGRTVNANKNPIAENAIKEYHKERLRLDPQGGLVTPQQLAIVIKNMNSRIRTRGLCSRKP